MQLLIDNYEPSDRFVKDLKGLAPEQRRMAAKALDRLQSHGGSTAIRCHTLPGWGNPLIYKIDIATNKSYQITFEIRGRTAYLHRVATHVEINRNPRS